MSVPADHAGATIKIILKCLVLILIDQILIEGVEDIMIVTEGLEVALVASAIHWKISGSKIEVLLEGHAMIAVHLGLDTEICREKPTLLEDRGLAGLLGNSEVFLEIIREMLEIEVEVLQGLWIVEAIRWREFGSRLSAWSS